MNKTLLFALAALGSALPSAHAQGTSNTFYNLDNIEYQHSEGYNESKSNYSAIGGADFGVNTVLSANGTGYRSASVRLPNTSFTTVIEWVWEGSGQPQPYGVTYTYTVSATARNPVGGNGTASGDNRITTPGASDTVVVNGTAFPGSTRSVVRAKGVHYGGQQRVVIMLSGEARGIAMTTGANQTPVANPGMADAQFTAMSTVQASLTGLIGPNGEAISVETADSRSEINTP